jgi:hypothetical protein
MLWLDRMRSRPLLAISLAIVLLNSGARFFISLHQHGAFPITKSVLFSLAVLLTISSGFIGKTDSNSLPKKPSP